MAFASDSTTAPFRHQRLLSATPVPTPALTAETVAMLDAVEPDTIDNVRRDLDALIAGTRAELPIPPLLSAADAARAIHLRRQLEAAAEHGAELLAALGLPRLVGPDHIVVDPVAAGDALDAAIAALDALDGDTDREPYLSGYYNPLSDPTGEGEPSDDDEDDDISEPSLASPEHSPWVPHSSEWRRHFRVDDASQARWAAGAQHDGEAVNEDGDTLDEHGEHDTADLEESCGWTAKVDQVHLGQAQDDHEETALERHGRGFLRSGPDDAEDDELGEDRAPDQVAWVFGPKRAEAAHV